MNSIAAFALLSLILTLTPGPDSLLVLRSSLRGGRHTGTRVAGGAASGSLFWGLCSAAGLTAIMAASAQTFRAVQLAGAAYLVFQGIRGWRAARPALADGDERPSPGPMLLRRPRTRAVLDRAAGTTLVALGVKVAAGQLA
jgi:threonine/homoserine/homoserine lactone efflux protein